MRWRQLRSYLTYVIALLTHLRVDFLLLFVLRRIFLCTLRVTVFIAQQRRGVARCLILLSLKRRYTQRNSLYYRSAAFSVEAANRCVSLLLSGRSLLCEKWGVLRSAMYSPR